LGFLLFTAGQYGAALPASERAVELARTSGDDRTQVLAAWNRVNLLQLLGRLGEALRVGQEVLPLVEAVGDLDGLLRAHVDLAWFHALQGALATSRAYIERAVALAEQMGDPGQLAFMLAFRGELALLSGEWPGAHADLEQAVAQSRQLDTWWSAYPLLFRARLSLAEGAWAEATAQTQEAVALAQRSGDLQALRLVSPVMAELDVLEGRPQAASARLVPLLDRPGLEECDVTLLMPVLAWAQLELGQVEQATATVAQVLRRARREEMRPVLVEALRVQALIALRQEHWVEAARSLEEGVALARSMPYPYAEARLLHVDGQLHAVLGEPGLARERLEGVRALFQRLGAQRDILRVEQALRCLSQNPPPSRHRSLRSCATRVTDAQWAVIEALLPPPARAGRPRADDRQTVEAILYKLNTGCAWSALPVELGDGVTAHRRLRAWQAAGVWAQIQAIVQDESA
jgi:tetratricopeptide (TPR) repeat protein